MWLIWLTNFNFFAEKNHFFNSTSSLRQSIFGVVICCGLLYPYYSNGQNLAQLNRINKITIDNLINQKEYFNAIFKIDTLLKSEYDITEFTYFAERQLFCFTKLSYELDFNSRFNSTYPKIRLTHKQNPFFQKFLITSANGFLQFEKFKSCKRLLKKVRVSKLTTEDELESYHLAVALL
jgi:hypothetical protein